MPKTAVEHAFTGTPASVTMLPAYDPDAVTTGTPLIRLENGSVGPLDVSVARPMEASTVVSSAYPHVIKRDDNTHWVFLADIATAAATRRVVMYEYKIAERIWSWRGFVSLSFPTATAFTIRGLRAVLNTYTTGTVATNGSVVTGTGTQWTTEGIAVGARIGFGSTNPADITQWFEIQTVSSETAMSVINGSGSRPGGTPYVIEEIRLVIAATNATVTNGGLFLVKGLSADAFAPNGTVISAATTIDNQRATYWLADAATVTNTVAGGVAIGPRVGNSRRVYVLNGTTTAGAYVYDIRAPLTGLSSGKTTSAFVLNTSSPAVTGTISQANNGRIATLNHGPGAGVECLYFVTSTRVYRAPVSGITQGSSVWLADAMVEIPPLGTATFAAGSAMSSIEHIASVDRLIIVGTNSQGARSNYLTRYQTAGDPFDDSFLIDYRHYDQSAASPDAPVFPDMGNTAMSVWAEDGIVYLCRNSTSSLTNQIYALPFGADSHFSAGVVITPRLATPNASRLHNVYIGHERYRGSFGVGVPLEPFRVYARTAGITDNSGAWTVLTDAQTLSGVTPGSHIQFKFDFRVVGMSCIPARIHRIAVTYEQGVDIPAHLRWNLTDSDIDTGIVGFSQRTVRGLVPDLEIALYRADNDALVFVQASTGTTNGVFEHFDGENWTAGLGQDVVGTHRRFRPTVGVPGGVELYATLREL